LYTYAFTPAVNVFEPVRPPPYPTLVPYTTLFRSSAAPSPRPPHPERGRSEFLSRRDRAGPAARQGEGLPALHTAGRPALRLERRSEEHTSELQSREKLVCRLLLEKKNTPKKDTGW